MISVLADTTQTIATQITGLIGIPTGIAGIGIPLYLWLTGKIALTSDQEKALGVLKSRIDALVADRDGWRKAYEEEVKARVAAEQAMSALLNSANLSSQLLDALKIELQKGKTP